MKTYISIIVLFLCTVVSAQSVTQSNTALSSKAMEAFSHKAETKVEEFYNYLQLLSDKSVNNEMKLHTANEIKKLFTDKEVTLVDIYNTSGTGITLDKLLENALSAKQKNYFTIKGFTGKPIQQISEKQQWLLSYEVSVNGSKYLKIEQDFFIIYENKKFGNTVKPVWNTYLGKSKKQQ